MMVMGDRCKDGVPPGAAEEPGGFVSSTTAAGVQLVVPIWILHMQLIRVDSNNGASRKGQKARSLGTRRSATINVELP